MSYRAVASVVFAVVVAWTGTVQGSDSLSEALSNGDAGLSFRYRAESVHQDGFSDNALASTLKTRLHYRTGRFGSIDAFIEVDDVSYLGSDDFNSLRNGNAAYPVVADPDGTAVNQVYLRATGELATVVFGRQRINHGNQRFVGGVGWRQNEQTYDAATITLTQDGDWSATYSYIDRVLRVFGPDAGTPDRALESNSHILSVTYSPAELGSVTGFGYFLDFDDAPGASNRTVGFSYQKAISADGFTVPVELAWATQNEYGDNPASYNADYRLMQVGIKADSFGVSVGSEVLKGSTAAGFSTPLATLHKFQGWADKFLTTPADGVTDNFVSLSTGIGRASATLGYHDFSADRGSKDYGQELDFSVGLPLTGDVGLLLKAARYKADGLGADTTKLWLMLSAQF